MAFLDKHEDQEAWLAWAIEFMRRGLYPEDKIEVHGPHAPHDFMWGSAFCTDIVDGGYFEVKFRTSRCSIWDIRGVTIKKTEKEYGHEVRFPIVAPSDLPSRWKRHLQKITAIRERLRPA